MTLSNYPPGVTGREYQIGGADREWTERRECPTCGVEAVLDHEAHREFPTGVIAYCNDPDCDGSDGFDVEPAEPEFEPDGPPESYWAAPDDSRYRAEMRDAERGGQVR